jgi:hypothetical protein
MVIRLAMSHSFRCLRRKKRRKDHAAPRKITPLSLGRTIKTAMTTWQAWAAVGLKNGTAQGKLGDPRKQEMTEVSAIVAVA